MQLRTFALASTLVFSALLAACSGSASPNPPGAPSPGGNPNPPPTDQNALVRSAVAAVNSVGAPIQANSDSNEVGGSSGGSIGQCVKAQNGGGSIKFISPDTKNDPNSTERQRFYDEACTQMAVDTIRLFTSPNGSGPETVTRTVTKFLLNSSTPVSVRNETIKYANGTYDMFGFPVVSQGLQRVASSTVTVNGAVSATTGDEFLAGAPMNPPSGASAASTYCGDTGGYNNTGSQALSESFGWSTTTDQSNGTRLVLKAAAGVSSGTVEFVMNRVGQSYAGPINSMSLQTGTANTTCPIAAPVFTVNAPGGFTGGALGNFKLPVVEQFYQGDLVSLTISNATLGNGDVLNVTTLKPAKGSSPNFITGKLTDSSGNAIATFNIDAFGFGSVEVVTGQQLQIADWHVVG